jgi:hypothetical protein
VVDDPVSQGECARTHKGIDDILQRIEKGNRDINAKQDKQIAAQSAMAQWMKNHDGAHDKDDDQEGTKRGHKISIVSVCISAAVAIGAVVVAIMK